MLYANAAVVVVCTLLFSCVRREHAVLRNALVVACAAVGLVAALPPAWMAANGVYIGAAAAAVRRASFGPRTLLVLVLLLLHCYHDYATPHFLWFDVRIRSSDALLAIAPKRYAPLLRCCTTGGMCAAAAWLLWQRTAPWSALLTMLVVLPLRCDEAYRVLRASMAPSSNETT